MSSPLLTLECFEVEGTPPSGAPLTPQDAESLRAHAFEDGYGAGWSDALEQMRDEDALRRAASEEALQAVAFGFHEARDGLESAFVDLARQLVTTLLPELRPVALRQHLEVELRALAARHFTGRLEILCAPGSSGAIMAVAQTNPGLDIALLEEPSFTEAQVLIRIDQMERQISIDNVIATLTATFSDTFKPKDTVNG